MTPPNSELGPFDDWYMQNFEEMDDDGVRCLLDEVFAELSPPDDPETAEANNEILDWLRLLEPGRMQPVYALTTELQGKIARAVSLNIIGALAQSSDDALRGLVVHERRDPNPLITMRANMLQAYLFNAVALAFASYTQLAARYQEYRVAWPLVIRSFVAAVATLKNGDYDKAMKELDAAFRDMVALYPSAFINAEEDDDEFGDF